MWVSHRAELIVLVAIQGAEPRVSIFKNAGEQVVGIWEHPIFAGLR